MGREFQERSGEDRRKGDRRKQQLPYEGPDRRSGTDRRSGEDRRKGDDRPD